ncbi:MAG: hypothetical protein R3D58_05975 [Saprospiraceae bacterium]
MSTSLATLKTITHICSCDTSLLLGIRVYKSSADTQCTQNQQPAVSS